MGEEKIVDTALTGITDQDFKEFLSEKVKVHTCPCCLENSWGILGETNNFTLGILAQPKNGNVMVPSPMIPLMGVACNICGYIRLHATGMIVQWKAEKDIAK